MADDRLYTKDLQKMSNVYKFSELYTVHQIQQRKLLRIISTMEVVSTNGETYYLIFHKCDIQILIHIVSQI